MLSLCSRSGTAARATADKPYALCWAHSQVALGVLGARKLLSLARGMVPSFQLQTCALSRTDFNEACLSVAHQGGASVIGLYGAVRPVGPKDARPCMIQRGHVDTEIKARRVGR